MPGLALIQTDQLTKVFRHPFFTWLIRARAVTDLDLSVRQGEVFGLLGPNGSGKSTTIKLILGLIFPTRGHVAVMGKRPNDITIKGRIGFLPEESYLYRFLDADETLDFYGRLFKLTRAEREHRIDLLLDKTGLRSERRRPIAEYSKGMQRRIGIAQALINDPDLVILDEPTTGLDPIGTREVKDLILELKAKGKTVLLSSHLLADVEDVCDRVSILYGGKTRASGPVGEVLMQERLTQITAEMDETTVKEVLELIRKRQGQDTDIRVAPPVERLEQFFLRVVADARQQQLQTSGAQAATGKLDFLTDSDVPEDLLMRLTQGESDVRAETRSAGTESGGPVVTGPEQRPAVLDRLTAGQVEQEYEEIAEAEANRIAEETEEADQSVLDKLVSGEDE